MSDENLHPNLARMAAAYDQIIEQLDAGQLTASQARSRIDQLEAKDDQGVRWSIDPESGDFVRRTAFGELEFGTPPAFGVASLDAFTVSDPDRDDNPALRLETQQVTAFTAPSAMMGATRESGPDPQYLPSDEGGKPSLVGRVKAVPARAKAIVALLVAAAVVAVGAFAFVSAQQDATPSPTISPSQAPSPSPSATGKKKKPKKPKKPHASATAAKPS